MKVVNAQVIKSDDLNLMCNIHERDMFELKNSKKNDLNPRKNDLIDDVA